MDAGGCAGMSWTLLLTQADPAKPPVNQWLLIALGGFTIAYIVFIRPNRKPKRPRDPLEQKPASTSLAQQRSIERDMANLLVEYEGMIRRMTAQVDTRATRLEMLIADAEEKIATLRSLSAAASRPTAEARRWTDAAGPVPDGGERESAVGDGALFAGPAAEEEPVDQRHREIYDLADGGLTARQIAHQLGRPNGEVDLILALRDTRS